MANKRRIGISVTVVIGLLTVLFILSTGVSSAQPSVTMEFESGYDEGQQTDTVGREISVEGELRVEDEAIVNPRVTVSSGEQTVIDQESFSVFVEAGEAELNSNPTREGMEVTADADRIPAGTTISMDFAAYHRNTNETEITAANVRVDFETEGGTRDSAEQSVSGTIEGWPHGVIEEQRNKIQNLREEDGENGGIPWIWIGGGIIAIFMLLVILAAIDQARG